jgi:hypothetical protein
MRYIAVQLEGSRIFDVKKGNAPGVIFVRLLIHLYRRRSMRRSKYALGILFGRCPFLQLIRKIHDIDPVPILVTPNQAALKLRLVP